MRILLAVILSLLPLAAFAQSQLPDATVIETLENQGNLRTFLRLVERAGLKKELEQPGPFTLFVPTDEAFAMLDSETLAELVLPERSGDLRDFLEQHIVVGPHPGSAFRGNEVWLTTMRGIQLKVNGVPEKMMVDKAVIERSDRKAGNGIVHVINQLLLHPEQPAIPVAPEAAADGTAPAPTPAPLEQAPEPAAPQPTAAESTASAPEEVPAAPQAQPPVLPQSDTPEPSLPESPPPLAAPDPVAPEPAASETEVETPAAPPPAPEAPHPPMVTPPPPPLP